MRKSLLWAAIAGVALLIVAIVVAGVFMFRERSQAGRRVDLDTWAATVCAAGETYVEAIVANIDQIDPQTLDLTPRKERAARIGRVQVDTARELLRALESVAPPEPAREYHQALIASAKEYIAAIEEQSVAIAKAGTPQQIAVANAQARFRLQANDRDVGAIAVNLSPQVIAALEKQPGCGPQQPGQPPGIRPPGGA